MKTIIKEKKPICKQSEENTIFKNNNTWDFKQGMGQCYFSLNTQIKSSSYSIYSKKCIEND